MCDGKALFPCRSSGALRILYAQPRSRVSADCFGLPAALRIVLRLKAILNGIARALEVLKFAESVRIQTLQAIKVTCPAAAGTGILQFTPPAPVPRSPQQRAMREIG